MDKKQAQNSPKTPPANPARRPLEEAKWFSAEISKLNALRHLENLQEEPLVPRTMKSLWLYCEILSLECVYLPRFDSELGCDHEFLYGVRNGWIDAPLAQEVEEVKAEYGFPDHTLFAYLKDAQ